MTTGYKMKLEKSNETVNDRLTPIWTTVPAYIDEKVTSQAKVKFVAKSDFWRKYILQGFEQEFGKL